MPSILFVCTANRFRSPLAAAMLKRAIEEQSGISDSWIVGSAGTWAEPGQPVMPVVAIVAGRLGVDLSCHRARRVSELLLSQYDLILTMQNSQREALKCEFPAVVERIFLLSKVVERGCYDIPDTYHSEREVMEIGLELNDLLRRGRDQICVLARANYNKRQWA
jgi:protein-tyrosine-phosphatase